MIYLLFVVALKPFCFLHSPPSPYLAFVPQEKEAMMETKGILIFQTFKGQGFWPNC